MATNDASRNETRGERAGGEPVEAIDRGAETSIADAGPADRDRRWTDARGIEAPAHPRLPAALLMLAVVVLLVAVSLLSVLGQAR